MSGSVNVAGFLADHASRCPDQLAVAMPRRPGAEVEDYQRTSFAELEAESSKLAQGLRDVGVKPGMRLALAVPFDTDFIRWVFALLKSGAVMVLVDPGMGRRQMLRCLEQVRLDGLVGISKAQALRTVMRRRFRHARVNVTIGRRWFWGGATQRKLLASDDTGFRPFSAKSEDPAAIIFTSGSTGPPKGVCYGHGSFFQQVEQIRDYYGIEAGEVDLPAFPLFGLFNAAMGVTSVIPWMDPTRPAKVDPEEIVRPVRQWKVSQSFGSPALWHVVGSYCEQNQIQLPSLRRVLSAGAPVPARVLARIKMALPASGEMFTPYGATEALPVASISATERLKLDADGDEFGSGICVGGKFPGIEWKLISISDEPHAEIADTEEVQQGEVGELIVRGPVVTESYFDLPQQTANHKIHDKHGGCWHRMGDVGFLDAERRFWFCGRKAHRVELADTTLFTIPAESILNRHESVFRSALVGVARGSTQKAVMIAELWPQHRCQSREDECRLQRELLGWLHDHPLTAVVDTVLLHPSLPVDIRHNAKIFREKLAAWAADQLR